MFQIYVLKKMLQKTVLKKVPKMFQKRFRKRFQKMFQKTFSLKIEYNLTGHHFGPILLSFCVHQVPKNKTHIWKQIELLCLFSFSILFLPFPFCKVFVCLFSWERGS